MLPAPVCIHHATVDMIVERGYEQTTVSAIVARAGISSAEFEHHFSDLEDCCIKTFDCIAKRCEANLYAAYESHDEWRDRLRAAAYAAAHFIDENPKEARFAVLELSRASDLAKARVEKAIELYADLIDAGRGELEDPESISRSTARAAVGSILGLVTRQVRQPRPTDAERLVPEMMYIAVRPYLGHGVARQELAGAMRLEAGGKNS